MSSGVRLFKFIRWQDWGTRTVSLIWTLGLYLAVAYDLAGYRFIQTFLVFLAFTLSQASFAYLINDWGDRDVDRKKFKHNAFAGLSQVESALIITLASLLAFACGAPFLPRTGFAELWLVWVVSVIAFSLEPLRLKTHGPVAPLIVVVAQWFLPVLLIFAAFQVVGGMDMWALAVAFCIHGLAIELERQCNRQSRDKNTGQDTFASKVSQDELETLYRWALTADKLAISAITLIVAWTLYSRAFAILLVGVLVSLYVVLLLVLPRASLPAVADGTDDHYIVQATSPSVPVHRYILHLVLPTSLAFALLPRSQEYFLILLLAALIYVSWTGFQAGGLFTFPFWARDAIRRRNRK